MIDSLLKLFGFTGQDKKTTDPMTDEILKFADNFQNRPIYKTLTADIILKIKDEELEQAIFDNISVNMEGDKREAREIVKVLTPGQRAIYVTWIVEGEVNNGGFNQFYFNSSGQLADMAEDAFKIIEATKFADLMRQANLIYNEIKTDLEKYNDGTIESFSKSYKENPLNDLDDKFYKQYAEEPLSQMKINYIKNNINEFVQ